jgi:hypothetical protein
MAKHDVELRLAAETLLSKHRINPSKKQQFVKVSDERKDGLDANRIVAVMQTVVSQHGGTAKKNDENEPGLHISNDDLKMVVENVNQAYDIEARRILRDFQITDKPVQTVVVRSKDVDADILRNTDLPNHAGVVARMPQIIRESVGGYNAFPTSFTNSTSLPVSKTILSAVQKSLRIANGTEHTQPVADEGMPEESVAAVKKAKQKKHSRIHASEEDHGYGRW